MTHSGDTLKSMTLGQAIDSMIEALSGLNQAERKNAIETVSRHFGLADNPPVSNKHTQDRAEASSEGTFITDIRTLKEQKKPRTAIEMAVLVAYYLGEVAPREERKETVQEEDIIKYFKQAGYPLPRATRQLLFNAKTAGYLDLVGRGKFKINPVGYNLVTHNMPRDNRSRTRSLTGRKTSAQQLKRKSSK